jgi:PTH2 family peptidyl-tRNA hydrolase
LEGKAAAAEDPGQRRSAPGEHRMMLLLRSDLKMGAGKLCAQAAHAAVAAYRAAECGSPGQRDALQRWLRGGATKVALRVGSEEALRELQSAAEARAVVAAPVFDAGRTQVAAGTLTCVALGPANESELGELTGELKLF